jgi:hypothetical protein
MEENRGRINTEVAKEILSDHYDVYLNKADNPCSRTVDGHSELDPFEYWQEWKPFYPEGAVDGKVMDSDSARDMTFMARWGNSSGMPFDAEDFLREHPQWGHFSGYLKDRPTEPCTQFRAGSYH